MRDLTEDDRKDVIIIDDTLFDKAGHKASYVLFDTWFASLRQIIRIRDMGLDTIAMVKRSSKLKYEFEGQRLNIKEIFSRCKKRRDRNRYLLSVEVIIGKDKTDEHPIPAQIYDSVCISTQG
ncbi:MAG: hypothetical protein IJH64_14460 [Oscillospiraceae bacterium]|nr:hypothetical protein [Oscillospiraceae bacterium]